MDSENIRGGFKLQPLCRAGSRCGRPLLLLVYWNHLSFSLCNYLECLCQVTNFVKDRIGALRRENPGMYGNISAIRTNSQKYLVNFFAKGQLTKLFFLFPVSLVSQPRSSLGQEPFRKL